PAGESPGYGAERGLPVRAGSPAEPPPRQPEHQLDDGPHQRRLEVHLAAPLLAEALDSVLRRPLELAAASYRPPDRRQDRQRRPRTQHGPPDQTVPVPPPGPAASPLGDGHAGGWRPAHEA